MKKTEKDEKEWNWIVENRKEWRRMKRIKEWKRIEENRKEWKRMIKNEKLW